MAKGKSRITFLYQPDFISEEQLVQALNRLANEHGRVIKELVYEFVSREKIIEINTNYLQHYYETDIVTFDYSVGSKVSAQIYICTDVVIDNAKDQGVTATEELNRVIFHGLLHVLGYNDHTNEERAEMRSMEDACLRRI